MSNFVQVYDNKSFSRPVSWYHCNIPLHVCVPSRGGTAMAVLFPFYHGSLPPNNSGLCSTCPIGMAVTLSATFVHGMGSDHDDAIGLVMCVMPTSWLL